MSRILRYITILFLLLAGVAITAHLIIPHDHHLTDSFSDKGESCPVSDGKTGHHPGFPVHCHAFNDLTSDRVIISFIPDKIWHKDLEISSLFKRTASELKLIFITISDIRESFPDLFLQEVSSLRAPPTLG
ncbi:MAG: hypothetical protein EPN88_17675 [Bacteroidetes bacterium]|nr:MAG: hypothetical protein EPN88_17675 [Bacteroidota bacterium]